MNRPSVWTMFVQQNKGENLPPPQPQGGFRFTSNKLFTVCNKWVIPSGFGVVFLQSTGSSIQVDSIFLILFYISLSNIGWYFQWLSPGFPEVYYCVLFYPLKRDCYHSGLLREHFTGSPHPFIAFKNKMHVWDFFSKKERERKKHTTTICLRRVWGAVWEMKTFYEKHRIANNEHWVRQQIKNPMLRETIRSNLAFIEQQMVIKSIKPRVSR